jgi:2-polyprenyl-6-methoxyphenol hydroxylase-like FAD-dependent oxidoreductase
VTITGFYDIVVVGGGVGGLALGCALAEKYHVLIIEARPRLVPSKRGLSLQANGLEALQKLDLLGRVSSIGLKTDHVACYEIDGSLLADLDYSILDHPHNYVLTLVPSELERVLRSEFSRRGGEIQESTSFKEVVLHHDSVRLRAQCNASFLEFSASIIVGADGENSRVRNGLRLPTKIRECPDHFLFMLAGQSDVLEEKARQYFGLGKMVGFFPLPEGTYIFYYLPAGRINDLRAEGLNRFKTELTNIMPEISDPLDSLISWDDIVYVAPKRVSVRHWVTYRAALLGDAVHAVDPSWAQGANMTLQDALVLANTIDQCFQSGDFSVFRLKAYENARRKQTTFVQQQSDRTARLTTTENRFNYWLGKQIIRRTGRNKTLMQTALKASAGLTDHFSIREQLRFII